MKALKQELHQQHGFPLRFRQRLFPCGSLSTLDDTAKLDSETDLELVLLTCLGGPNEPYIIGVIHPMLVQSLLGT